MTTNEIAAAERVKHLARLEAGGVAMLTCNDYNALIDVRDAYLKLIAEHDETNATKSETEHKIKSSLAKLLDSCFCDDNGYECQRCQRVRTAWNALASPNITSPAGGA